MTKLYRIEEKSEEKRRKITEDKREHKGNIRKVKQKIGLKKEDKGIYGEDNRI